MHSLWVKNDREELIARVQWHQSLQSSSSSSSSSSTQTMTWEQAFPAIPLAEKLVVREYSKERAILERTVKQAVRLSLCGENEAESDKLRRFARYLQERMKAATVRVGPLDLHLLPGWRVGSEGGGGGGGGGCVDCLVVSVDPTKSALAYSQPAAQPVATPAAPVAAPPAATATAASAPAAASTAAAPAGSLLATLLSKAKATSEARKGLVHTNAAKINQVKSFTQSLHDLIRNFDLDESRTELHLEPMDKESKYIVYEVMEDYPDLIAETIGEKEDRHIAIFKKGFQPSVETDPNALPLSQQTLRLMKSKTNGQGVKRPAQTLQDMAPTIQNHLVRLNEVKRDRRTTEDILQEIKRRKGEDSSSTNTTTNTTTP